MWIKARLGEHLDPILRHTQDYLHLRENFLRNLMKAETEVMAPVASQLISKVVDEKPVSEKGL